MLFPHFKNEMRCLKEGFALVAGCDEAGRGPMAGPGVAAACGLDPATIGKTRVRSRWYARVRDSKMIPETERQTLYVKILENALAHGVGIVSVSEIDELNIHHASLKAMRLAVENLVEQFKKGKDCRKIHLLVDGRFSIPNLSLAGVEVVQTSLVHGDALSLDFRGVHYCKSGERCYYA